jgi:hypothetical protein
MYYSEYKERVDSISDMLLNTGSCKLAIFEIFILMLQLKSEIDKLKPNEGLTHNE